MVYIALGVGFIGLVVVFSFVITGLAILAIGKRSDQPEITMSDHRAQVEQWQKTLDRAKNGNR